MTGSARFSSLVQCFFTKHLCEHKQVSPRTVTAYRDTFRLLFTFMQKANRQNTKLAGTLRSGRSGRAGVPGTS